MDRIPSPPQTSSTQRSSPTSKQHHVTQDRVASGVKFLAIVVGLALIATGLGPAVLLVVAGTTTPVLLLVYFFIASVCSHRGADSYPDYIKLSVPI